jgi:hypothetical protein
MDAKVKNMNILAKNNLVFLRTPDEFDEFIHKLDLDWETKAETHDDAFTQWVNHYYASLLTGLGPSNCHLFS